MASGGSKESKVTSPNLCRLETIQLEKKSSVSTCDMDRVGKRLHNVIFIFILILSSKIELFLRLLLILEQKACEFTMCP